MNDKIVTISCLFVVLAACHGGKADAQGKAGEKKAVVVEDGAPSCGTPNPFAPPGRRAVFRHKRSMVTVKLGRPRHRGRDTLVFEGEAQVLIGKFAYGKTHKDLKDEEVEIFIQKEAPCGPWVSVGTAPTTRDGDYGTDYGIYDDGGRVFYTFPARAALPAGRYPAVMLVIGDDSMARMEIHVFKKGEQAVVFDIDGTLTIGDSEIVREVLEDPVGDYSPEMRKGAVEVVKAIAAKGYRIIYITGRPETLTGKTREWLEEKDFPPGALRTTDRTSQVMPTARGVERFKTDVLTDLTARGLNIFAAYGNATTDIAAYQNAGIAKKRTFIIGKYAGNDDTVAVTSYVEHLETAKAFPDAR